MKYKAKPAPNKISILNSIFFKEKLAIVEKFSTVVDQIIMFTIIAVVKFFFFSRIFKESFIFKNEMLFHQILQQRYFV